MKKRFLILAIFLALVAGAVWAYVYYKSAHSFRIFAEAITYRDYTYDPYEVLYFKELLQKSAGEKWQISEEKPGEKAAFLKQKQAVYIVCSPHFLPTKTEVKRLQKFVAEGNTVLVSTFNMSPAFLDALLKSPKESSYYHNWPPLRKESDSLTIRWARGAAAGRQYTYPGSDVEQHRHEQFARASHVLVHSYAADGAAALVEVPHGRGSFFVQLKPMSFTNYFLLHKANYQYFTDVWKIIRGTGRTLIWDDYFRRRVARDERPPGRSEEPVSFQDLMARHPPLQWAVWVLMGGVVLYVLVHAPRRVAAVRVVPVPQNTSLAFVRALTNVYWQQADYASIAEKLVLQWQDALQRQHHVPLKYIHEQNAFFIAEKTNRPVEDIEWIFKKINDLSQNPDIYYKELIQLYERIYPFFLAR